MSFTYPLATADFWEATFIGPAVMDLTKPMRKTGSTRGGKVLMKIDGTAKWVGSATFAPHYNRDSISMEARLRKLGAGGTFLAYDLRAPYPAADPDGSKLGNGSLVALGGEAAYGDVSLGAYRYEGNVVTLAQAASVVGDAGTYYDIAGVLRTSAANTLRVDHDPVTHAVRGVLVEPAFTNGLFPSNTMTGWATNVSPSFTTGGTGPDGNACPRVTYDASSASSGYFKTSGAVALGVTYTWSVYVKFVSGTARFRFGCASALFGTGAQTATIDMDPSTGTIVGGPGAGVSAWSIESVGNGWYRVIVSAVCATASATHAVVAYHGVAAAGVNDTFGFQWVQGASPRSYVATTSAAVARAIDAITFRAKGRNDWTLTYDNGATSSHPDVTGNWTPNLAFVTRPNIKAWSSIRDTQPAAAAPTVASVGVDNTSLALNVPPFFKITMGDYISFPRSNGKRMLVQALEDAVANYLGVTAELQVQPPLRSGSLAGAAVTLIKAPAEFMIPDGWTAPTGNGTISDGMAFMFEESL